MSWLETLPALLVALAIVLLPGGALAWSLGFRRTSLVGLAPVLSLSIAGVGAVLAPFLGVGWGIGVVIVTAVVASAAAWAIMQRPWERQKGRLFQRGVQHGDGWPTLAAGAIGTVAGAFLIARRFIQLVGEPDSISQRYDNVFHLNAVRYVLDTGNASTLNLGSMAGGTGGLSSVYPAVWHSLGALVSQLTGASVPVSVNIVNLVASAVIWPISVVFLTRVIIGARPVGLMAAGVMSAGFLAFPYLLLVWGPLFPNLLSVSALPAGVAAVIFVCRLSPTLREPPVRAWLVLLMAVPGLALSHMSAVNALLAFSIPVVLSRLFLYVREMIRTKASVAKSAAVALASVTGAVAVVVAWQKLRPAPYNGWTPHQTVPGAIGEVIANGPMKTDATLLISVLALVGIARIIRRRSQLWLLGCYVVAGFLYVVAAGFAAGWARAFFTGTWYQDTYRLASYLPIFVVVLAALGVLAAADAIKPVAGKLALRLRPVRGIRLSGVPGFAGLLVSCLVLGWAAQTGPVRGYVASNQYFFERDTKDSIVSSDEYALLARLGSKVPEDAVIAVNPWNGGALAYAFADRKVLEFHMGQRESESMRVVAESLAEADSSPKVCDAVRQTKVSYALDFGKQYLLDHPESRTYPGLQDLASSDAVQLVDQQGDAKLFKVVACS